MSDKNLNNDPQRYKAQVALADFGAEAQSSLGKARVLIVGVGGLGCPAALYLATSGIGRIGLIDGDRVELSNLPRQVLFREEDCGKFKVEVGARHLERLRSDLEVESYAEQITTENALSLVSAYDLVIDGSDNFGTRYLVNDACVISGKPFLSASVFQMEGQLGFYNVPILEAQRTATYRDLYLEPPDTSSTPACSESGVLAPVPGVLGSLLASEAIQFLGTESSSLVGAFATLNFSTLEFQHLKLSRAEERSPGESSLFDQATYDQYSGDCVELASDPKEVSEMTVRELDSILKNGEQVFLLDVREPYERTLAEIGGVLIPLSDLPTRASEIPIDRQVVVYCRSGQRSYAAVRFLQEELGYSNLHNLAGGILAWSDLIDGNVAKY